MTWDEVRALAAALPGVEDGTSYGRPALKAYGKALSVIGRTDDHLVVFDVGHDERALLIEMEPDTFFVTEHYRGYPTVLARLEPLTAERLRPLLERRWRAVAPKRAVRAFDAAAQGGMRG